MLVGEIVLRKRKIEQDISDYKVYIENIPNDTRPQDNGVLYTNVLNSIFDLYNKLQSHNALLDKENTTTEIKFGDSSLSILDALHICKTIDKKIKVLGCIISKNDYSLDIKELINSRDKLMEEFISLRKVIDVSDWSTDVE